MFRIFRTGNGAHFGGSYQTLEEALKDWERFKGGWRHMELQDDDKGIIKTYRKYYKNGKLEVEETEL